MNSNCGLTRVRSFQGRCGRITRAAALVGLSIFPLISIISGCGGAISAKSQNYDAATATAKAMEMYDRNGDGQLSVVELEACPALAVGTHHIDRNRDGTLTAEEIQARLQSLDDQSDFIGLDLQVTAKGRPLVGALLTLTPEPFMGAGLQAYSGTTVEGGGCPLKGEKMQLPGIPVGFYQVQVVQADHGINEVRGCEIADDTTGNRLQIVL